MVRVNAGHRLSCPAGCPESIYNVMLRCWERDPGRRAQISQIHKELKDIQRGFKGKPPLGGSGNRRLQTPALPATPPTTKATAYQANQYGNGANSTYQAGNNQYQRSDYGPGSSPYQAGNYGANTPNHYQSSNYGATNHYQSTTYGPGGGYAPTPAPTPTADFAQRSAPPSPALVTSHAPEQSQPNYHQQSAPSSTMTAGTGSGSRGLASADEIQRRIQRIKQDESDYDYYRRRQNKCLVS
eukprot:TRINITY_DN3362_c0_g1_i2.p1 TRINITY_DN3362_c0_g1~~TRINITY_DN3362_c0_g1_i2.p1  ORF type:complete len:241 (-),score=30.85 TRINITY_DN3362_c0_g1_i2:48-770(-)